MAEVEETLDYHSGTEREGGRGQLLVLWRRFRLRRLASWRARCGVSLHGRVGLCCRCSVYGCACVEKRDRETERERGGQNCNLLTLPSSSQIEPLGAAPPHDVPTTTASTSTSTSYRVCAIVRLLLVSFFPRFSGLSSLAAALHPPRGPKTWPTKPVLSWTARCKWDKACRAEENLSERRLHKSSATPWVAGRARGPEMIYRRLPPLQQGVFGLVGSSSAFPLELFSSLFFFSLSLSFIIVLSQYTHAEYAGLTHLSTALINAHSPSFPPSPPSLSSSQSNSRSNASPGF